jgi:hypothetical protein
VRRIENSEQKTDILGRTVSRDGKDQYRKPPDVLTIGGTRHDPEKTLHIREDLHVPKQKAAARKPSRLTARNADPNKLYEMAVQCPEAEIDFVDQRFFKLRGRRAVSFREDFCASAASACEWVRRRAGNRALGLDLNPKILAWGRKHNIGALTPEQQSRITLLERNVLDPGPEGRGFDVVAAMNFSYWIFMTRAEMLRYFKTVREGLVKDGIFFLDSYGGWESMKTQVERRRIKGGFTYIWDQAKFDPITHDLTCHIHFDFPDKSKITKAFTYEWRLWTLPEIRELLAEAGFRNITVYWEGDNDSGGGNGIFKPAKRGEDGPSFIVYMTAER